MNSHSDNRRRSGRAWLLVLVVIVAVAAIGGGAWFVYQSRQSAEEAGDRVGSRGQTVDEQIEQLQNQFKTYSEGNYDFNNLLPEVKQFTDAYPDRADGQVLLGQVYMKLERWEEALVPLGRALEIEPGFYELQKLAGTCAAKLGRWEEAEHHLTKALSLQADREIHMMLGSVYYKTDRNALAEEQYLLALDKTRATPPHMAHSGLADVYSQRGELDKALEHVDEAIAWSAADYSVEDYTYTLQKVRLLLDAGQLADASALLISVLDSYPEASDTLAYAKLQARIWDQRERYAAIPGLFEGIYARTIAQPDPDPAILGDALAELAHWRLELGQVDQATQAIARLRVTRPNHPRLNELSARLIDAQ